MESLGRILIPAGCVAADCGRTDSASGLGLPLGRLPGDFAVRGKHFAFYAPLATSLTLSIVLSVLFWVIHHLRR